MPSTNPKQTPLSRRGSATSSVPSKSARSISMASSDASWMTDDDTVQAKLQSLKKRNPSGEFEYVRRHPWDTAYIRKPSVDSNFNFPPSPAVSAKSSRRNSLASNVPLPMTTPQDLEIQKIVQRMGRYGPVCIFLRHCQGEHNIGATRNGVGNLGGDDLPDPPLSDLGNIQAKELKTAYPYLFPLVKGLGGKFLISNLRRTRETAFKGWPELLELENHKMIEIRPELQEDTSDPCDIGKSPADMEKEYPGIDYSRCVEEVNSKKGIYRPSATPIRGKALMKKVQKRREPILVFVSHGITLYDIMSGRHWREAGGCSLKPAEAAVRVFGDAKGKLDTPAKKYSKAVLTGKI